MLSNIELDFTKTNTKHKKLAEGLTEPIKIMQTVCAKEGENNNPVESAGNIKENKFFLVSKKENKNTQFVAANLTSLPLIETTEVAENANCNNNFITPLTTLNISITVSTEHNTSKHPKHSTKRIF